MTGFLAVFGALQAWQNGPNGRPAYASKLPGILLSL